MDALQEILQVMTSGPAAVEAWTTANASRIDTALGDSVYSKASACFDAGRLGDAAPFYFTAMRLYSVSGPEERALVAAFNYLQILYMAADTVEAYESVRTQLLIVGKRALDGGHLYVSFNAYVVAADSAFVAADLSHGAVDWLFRSLEDLRHAASGATLPLPPSAMELYTNVAANLWVLARSADWGPRTAAAEELLFSLAAESERIVPVGFTLPSDPAKTEFIAVNLAALSDEYGNPNSAGARRAALPQPQ